MARSTLFITFFILVITPNNVVGPDGKSKKLARADPERVAQYRMGKQLKRNEVARGKLSHTEALYSSSNHLQIPYTSFRREWDDEVGGARDVGEGAREEKRGGGRSREERDCPDWKDPLTK